MNFADLTVVATAGDARQAALFLHAMAPSDRQWLLAELSEPKRAALQQLLEELAVLGVPADQMFLNQVLTVTTPSTLSADLHPPHYQKYTESTEQESTDTDALMRLTEPCIAALALALRMEPVRLVMQCMLIAPWPWRDTLLDRLHVVQRRQVLDMLESAPAYVRSDSVYGRALLKNMRQVCASIDSEHHPGTSQIPPGKLPWLKKMRHILGGSRS